MSGQNLKIVIDERREDGDDVIVKAARPTLEDLLRASSTKIGDKVIEVNTETLLREMSAAYSQVIDMLTRLPQSEGPFRVQTVSFTLVIDSTGGVSLLSSLSSSVKNQVGLTFTLSNAGEYGNVKVDKA